MKTIILASSSPRRKRLLENIGLEFNVEPSDVVEHADAGSEPHDLARRLSLNKALAVAARHKNAIVIAADTLGVLNGRVLGKPQTENEAFDMLQSMSGKCHTVITGFTIIDSETQKMITRSVETRVCFRDLTTTEITTYIKSGEPTDKSGAYAIQGLGALLVERIVGDYPNVMGLPLNALALALRDFGIEALAGKVVRPPDP